MDKHLHIVCFDVPWPADYGGVIDVFYRIKALHELGIKIHLHCFEYGRGEQSELNKYCVEVNYYKRNTGLKGFSFRLPYTVKSRDNKRLLENLCKDEHPILLEGIHCTYFLFTNQLKGKKIFVRLHNVEFEYYHQLAKNETVIFKKAYFKYESRLLKKYEENIAGGAMLLAINRKDAEVYEQMFNADNIKYLPAFVQYNLITVKEGKGSFCLYHGNLSVAENEKAAIWLCKNIFKQLNIPFVIAGKNPSKNLKEIADQNKNISILSNPSKEEMDNLITEAQVNLLPSFNSTGVKIKLLNALFTGRHCVINKATVNGTGLESHCHIAESEEDFRAVVKQLFVQPFTVLEIEKRKDILELFDNKKNAELLTQWIY